MQMSDVQVDFVNWWDPGMTPEKRKQIATRSVEVIKNSTFAFCPRGNGCRLRVKALLMLIDLLFPQA